jgi:hypothetical protein
LGYGLDISGDEIIAGANMEDEDEAEDNPLPEAGSVFLFNKTTSGIYEEAVKQFSIYPNPTTDVLNVAYDGAILRYEILDLAGRSITAERTMRIGKLQVDVSQLNTGVYLIRFNNGKAIPFSVVR